MAVGRRLILAAGAIARIGYQCDKPAADMVAAALLIIDSLDDRRIETNKLPGTAAISFRGSGID